MLSHGSMQRADPSEVNINEDPAINAWLSRTEAGPGSTQVTGWCCLVFCVEANMQSSLGEHLNASMNERPGSIYAGLRSTL